MNKKILFISTSRADYNLISGLYKTIKLKKNFNKKLILTGSSISKKYGYDKNKDFTTNKKIFINLTSSSKKKFPTILSTYFKKFYLLLNKENPNFLVILGDRYETLVLTFVAKLLGIKIFHFHGGEKSYGSLDNEWRDLISKLSDYHFVSHKDYKKNLIKLNLDNKKIFVVGSIGAYLLKKHKPLRININKKYKKKIIVTYHVATKDIKKSRQEFLEMIDSIKKLKNFYFCITYPGHDLDSNFIINKLDHLKKNFNHVEIIKKASIYSFYDYLKNFDLFMGNSSSGIIESASANIPFLNIGLRQNGRLKSNNVFDVEGKNKIISKSIVKILKLNKKKFKNIYLDTNFKTKINNIIFKKILWSFSIKVKYQNV